MLTPGLGNLEHGEVPVEVEDALGLVDVAAGGASRKLIGSAGSRNACQSNRRLLSSSNGRSRMTVSNRLTVAFDGFTTHKSKTDRRRSAYRSTSATC